MNSLTENPEMEPSKRLPYPSSIVDPKADPDWIQEDKNDPEKFNTVK